MHVHRGRSTRRDDAVEALLCHPLLARIGETPLIELRRLPGGEGTRVFAKLEGANPGGSVKDRAARAVVIGGLRGRRLPGKRLLDATSGNTGIAYAMLGAALGFGVTLCVPASASPERRSILHAYGAQVVETDALEGSDGAIRRARELSAERPDLYWYADQYSNPANPLAHERTTGPELLRQMGGRPLDLFVASLGTSGTFVGTGRFLRRASPGTRLASVEPDGPFHGIEGLKHMASALVPAIYDPALADLRVGVSTEEAQETTRRLAREEGLLVGPSSGAAVCATLRLSRQLELRTAAVVLPDGGDRYLSDRFWGEA
ncbi:MAG TPA: cysteine synthase family protein [Vicinamibacteria bacterium]|nr:cysteine synthase family protein [Vicinamibacteria bacterium]